MASNFTLYAPLVRIARDAKIVGGVEALPGEFPHQVAITHDDDFICGGSIINPILILTAAHCVLSSTFPHMSLLKVIAGLHNLTVAGVGEQVRDIKLVYTHEGYNNNTFENDIAILLLSEPLRYTNTIRNVRLPRKGEEFQGIATISGWGSTKFGGWGSVKLRKVSIPIVSPDICQARYKDSYNITDSMLCIGGTDADSCQGDSGGAAICMRNDSTKIQCGIVSFGVGCGRKEVPGVYTLVSSHIDWIEKAEKQIVLMECMVNYLHMGSLSAVSEVASVYDLQSNYHEVANRNAMTMAKLSSGFKTDTKRDAEFIKTKIRVLERASERLYLETIELKKDAIMHCVATTTQIKAENVTTDINWLDDDTELSKFINNTYKKFGKSNILLMLQFIDELPTFRQKQIAESAILEAMREGGDSRTLVTLHFQNALSLCRSDFDSYMAEICLLALDKIGDNIRAGIFEEVFKIAIDNPTGFRTVLGGIIKNSYATSIKNFEIVVQFSIGLPLKSDEVFALCTLFDVMRNSTGFNGSEILTIAFRAKMLRDVLEREKTKDESTFDMISKLDEIKSLLPYNLHCLVFKDSVHLVSAGKGIALGIKTNHNRTLLCPSNTTRSGGFERQWKIVPIEDGKYIMITSKYFLYALAVVDEAVLSVGYNDLGYIKSDNRFHWQAFASARYFGSESSEVYFKNRNSMTILVKAEDVGDGCSSINTVDAYSKYAPNIGTLWSIFEPRYG